MRAIEKPVTTRRIHGKVRAKTAKTKMSLKNILKTTNAAKWELFIPVILVVGIFGGFVTLGEVASIMVAYAFLVAVFIHRDLKLRDFPGVIRESMVLVGTIFIIFSSALALTTYMIDAGRSASER